MDAHLKRIEPRFLLYGITRNAEFLLISILAVKPAELCLNLRRRQKLCTGQESDSFEQKEKRKLPGESLNIVVSRKRNQMVLVMCC
jgi:hypothetical protein